MDRGGNVIFDFLSKAYAMVDDPWTDLIISWGPNGNSFLVWNPQECCRLLGITNFIRFETYGFEKVEPGGVLEFASNDFVRGQPELLEKIYDRYMEKVNAYNALKWKPRVDRLKKCKTREEWDLVTKENMESIERDDRERTDKALAVELKDLLKHIVKERESRGQPLSKELEDLLQMSTQNITPRVANASQSAKLTGNTLL